jgi:DedD protein
MSDQQAELRRKARRRLIGAIILVALLVIFLPMVLDREPKPIGVDVPVRMPQPESAAANAPAPAAVPEPIVPPSSEPRAESPASTPAPSASETTTPATVSEVQHATDADKTASSNAGSGAAAAEAAPAARSAASGAKRAAPAGGEFVVQVGAFSSASKAAQAQRKVAAAGLPVFTETVEVGGQERIRVRAGPFTQRAEAEAALEKLSDIGFGGKLMMK